MKKSILFTTALLCASTLIMQAQNKNPKAKNGVQTKEMQTSHTPKQALQELKEGNQRFVSGKMIKRDFKSQVKQSAKGQYPSAVLLSCIDSRTSSELIFDLGMGDVFNARIAGNFENTDIIGSMEFACKVAGAKLIAVIGHSNCGAVKGACDKVALGNLTNVINQIQPAVEAVKDVNGERNSKNHDFVEAVSKGNVLMTMNDIREKSPILKEMETKGEIMIVGGMYNLETGVVEFYNN